MVKISFDLLTKAQHAVMDALCTSVISTMAADNFKPATLGSLCGMGLVDVVAGKASSTCTFLWNMTYHSEMYGDISEACMKEIQEEIDSGRRIGAIKSLRMHSGLSLENSVVWMNHHFPK